MVRRFGEMIKIKPEGLEQYKAYHANPLPGVNEMIKACHLKNYSIYQRGDYMFTYYDTMARTLKQIWQKWRQIRQPSIGGAW